MGNEVSAVVIEQRAEAPAAARMSADERRANETLLRATLLAALAEVSAAVRAWPVPDDARYAGMPAMVRAAEQLLAALTADLDDAARFEHAMFRLAVPAYDLGWIRSVFDAYARDMAIANYARAAEQRAAADHIIDVVTRYELQQRSYMRFQQEHDGGYAAQHAANTQRGRKRKRVAPISAAEREALAARLAAQRPALPADLQTALDRVLDALRTDPAKVRRSMNRFADATHRAPMSAALAECCNLLVAAADAVEAAEEAAETPDRAAPLA